MAGGAHGFGSQVDQQPDPVPIAAQRLADTFHRSARLILASSATSIEVMDAALLLAEQAIEIDPDDPSLWRSYLALADLAERADLQQRALAKLSELEPFDEVIRLRRLSNAVERFSTAEERISAYQKLLTPEAQEKIGPAVASRLAHDLAKLSERVGDSDQMSHWLAEAVRLDPANRSAVAFATGYFRQRVTDPFGEAELLTALLMADPADVATLQTLGQHLLAQSANPEAVRLLDLARRHATLGGRIAPDGLVADVAIALWAAGRPDEAVDVIDRHLDTLDSAFRYHRRLEDADLARDELMQLRAPLPPTLGVIRTAILRAVQSDQADASLAAVLDAFSTQAKGLTEADKETLVPILLEAAWTGLIFGGEPESLEKAIDDAHSMMPLTDQARSRFDGLIALRRGEVDRAIELLTPLAPEDTSARIGLTLAWLEQGRHEDAARALVDLARDQQGTLVGAWASDRLQRILGQRPGPRDPELVQRLSDLMASIPTVVDRFAHDASLAVAVRVTPAKPVFGPFEPVMVNVEVTNNSPLPLAIDRDGPIQPLVAIVPTMRISGVPEIGQLLPVIVDVGRKLRLQPRERLIVPIDLRQTHMGMVLDSIPLRGATIMLRATSNFEITSAQVIVPDTLGMQIEPSPLRVDGENVTPEWLQAQVALIAPQTQASDGQAEVGGTTSEVTGVPDDGQPDDVVDDDSGAKQSDGGEILPEGAPPQVVSPDEAAAGASDAENALPREDGMFDDDAALDDSITDRELVTLALLMRVVTDGPPPEWPADQHALLTQASAAVLDAIPRTPPFGQAWLLSVLPSVPQAEPISALLRPVDDRSVRLAYLLYRVSAADDPMLEEAMRSADPAVRKLGEVLHTAFTQAEVDTSPDSAEDAPPR